MMKISDSLRVKCDNVYTLNKFNKFNK